MDLVVFPVMFNLRLSKWIHQIASRDEHKLAIIVPRLLYRWLQELKRSDRLSVSDMPAMTT